MSMLAATRWKARATMDAKLLTYDDMAPHLSWPDAVEALRRGHRLARPQIGDLFLGPPKARS